MKIMKIMKRFWRTAENICFVMIFALSGLQNKFLMVHFGFFPS